MHWTSKKHQQIDEQSFNYATILFPYIVACGIEEIESKIAMPVPRTICKLYVWDVVCRCLLLTTCVPVTITRWIFNNAKALDTCIQAIKRTQIRTTDELYDYFSKFHFFCFDSLTDLSVNWGIGLCVSVCVCLELPMTHVFFFSLLFLSLSIAKFTIFSGAVFFHELSHSSWLHEWLNSILWLNWRASDQCNNCLLHLFYCAANI